MNSICNNMLMIVLDPKGFGAEIPFKSEIDQLVHHVSSSATAEGHDRIRFPGDPERETTEARLRDGIPIDETTWAAMTQAGLDFGMSEEAFKVN